MPVLEFQQVTKVFGSGAAEVRALNDVDFTLEQREVVAVMGPSGSGKTTMLTIGGALQKPTAGRVLVGDEPIEGLSQTDLSAVRRHKIGFIFQSFNLLEALTAEENVGYALALAGHTGRHGRERARQLLAMLDLGHRLDVLPKRMSGGERQRVAIARALANDGQLLLADEPTASLDHKRTMELLQILHQIARDLGRGIMIVTHDMRVHDMADRTFWLEDGKLAPIEHGALHARPHDALPTDPPKPAAAAEHG